MAGYCHRPAGAAVVRLRLGYDVGLRLLGASADTTGQGNRPPWHMDTDIWMRKLLIVLSLWAILGSHLTGCATPAGPTSIAERNGFLLQEPLMHIKRGFLVAADERVIVGEINDASTSIASFIQEIFELKLGRSRDSLKHVLPEARQTLRLPPVDSRGEPDRYVAMLFYCWKSIDSDRLQVRIEWSDVTTSNRYTDSYVFRKSGPAWYFEQHGDFQPIHWLPKQRYFTRAC